MPSQFEIAFGRLDAHLTALDLQGPDPYDGLSAAWTQRVPRGRCKQLVVQAIKRAPLNLRPLLGVQPVRMAKTLALASIALGRSASTSASASRRERLNVELLAGVNPDGAWGYEFDVQTRWGFYAAGTSNAVVTSFVALALVEANSAARVPPTVAAFIRDELMASKEWFGYTRQASSLVHNANLLAARSYWQLNGPGPAVDSAVRNTVERQRRDGLWSYGEGMGLEWIDNFHTAYVLWCLRDLRSSVDGANEAFERGHAAWTATCFEDDGTPRYYAGRAGRVDVHNVATAVSLLAITADESMESRRLLPGAVHALLSLQSPDGGFRAGRQPEFPRWNDGHALLALADVGRIDSPRAC